MFCDIGDTVLYTKFSGTPIGLEDADNSPVTYLMVNQRDILAAVSLDKDGHTLVLPIGERYIIKQYEPEKKTASGIIIPGKAVETQYQGTVVAVGQGICLENGQLTPMVYGAGQSVLFVRYAGTPIIVNAEKFLILNQRDIVCIIEGGDHPRD